MDRWKYYEGKKVFITLKNKRVYSGEVFFIDESNPQFIYITLIDKYEKRITFLASEISFIQEEE